LARFFAFFMILPIRFSLVVHSGPQSVYWQAGGMEFCRGVRCASTNRTPVVGEKSRSTSTLRRSASSCCAHRNRRLLLKSRRVRRRPQRAAAGAVSTMVLDDPSGAACRPGGVCPCGLSAGAPPELGSRGPVRPWGCICPSWGR
jgi:hypothetical protein